MTTSALIVLFGWGVVVLVLFAVLAGRRAAVAAFVAGWLFLPVVTYPIAGLPDYDKMAATCVPPFLAMCIFDFRQLLKLRPYWADVPILVFCVSPFASAIQNGLGIHEGLSVVFAQSVAWGIPYTIGRCYFDDLPSLRELAIAILAGGVIYVPLSLFELWSGLQLSQLVYGYHQLVPVISFGIVRPKVFLQSGLMLALWMASAALVVIWLWKSGAMPKTKNISTGWLVAVLIANVILIRSVNGWIELVVGAGLLFLVTRWRTTAPVIGLILLILIYIGVRAAGVWSGGQIVDGVRKVLNKQKSRSIQYRFVNEDVIAANARQHVLVGWGRQESVTVDQRTSQRAVPDSLWIIVFGSYGALGLFGLAGSILLPVILFVSRIPAGKWSEPGIAPAASLAMLLVVFMTDNLANAMEHPVFMLAAGGLSGFLMTYRAKVARAEA
jgi:hypothetical protein